MTISPTRLRRGPVLDFSTAASRDFSTLSPQLKQVFFIGDGLDSSGSLQTFVVPRGSNLLDSMSESWMRTGGGGIILEQ